MEKMAKDQRKLTKALSAQGESGIPNGRVGSESMRIDWAGEADTNPLSGDLKVAR
jgi:hypothetical protein